MAALVQSFPQQSTTTITMIQTRPASAGGMLQNTSQGQQYPPSSSQMHRNSYHGMNGGTPTTYRGQTSMGPVAPYAFTSTPGLSGNGARNSPYLRQDQRTASAPAIPTIQTPEPAIRSRYPAPASISTTSTSSSSASDLSRGTPATVARNEPVVGSTAWVAQRVPAPTVITSSMTTSTTQSQLSVSSPVSTKPSPDRYRRPAQRRTDSGPPSPQQATPGSQSPSNSGAPNTGYVYHQATAGATPNNYQFIGQIPQIPPMQQSATFNPNLALRSAVDDMSLTRQATREEASRYRRRSIHTTDMNAFSEAQMKAFSQQVRSQHATRASSAGGPQDQTHPLRISPVSSRPASSPGRSGSSENSPSSHSNQSRPSSVSSTLNK